MHVKYSSISYDLVPPFLFAHQSPLRSTGGQLKCNTLFPGLYGESLRHGRRACATLWFLPFTLLYRNRPPPFCPLHNISPFPNTLCDLGLVDAAHRVRDAFQELRELVGYSLQSGRCHARATSISSRISVTHCPFHSSQSPVMVRMGRKGFNPTKQASLKR